MNMATLDRPDSESKPSGRTVPVPSYKNPQPVVSNNERRIGGNTTVESERHGQKKAQRIGPEKFFDREAAGGDQDLKYSPGRS